MRIFTTLVLLALVGSGCGTYEALRGAPGRQVSRQAPAPAREVRWVLVKNPRFGGSPSEPEYIWVEDDKIPGTLTTALFGKNSALAPREELARYGPPPGNGKVSPLQGGPPIGSPATGLASLTPGAAPGAARPGPEPERPQVREVTPRGYIVHIDKRLIVVDLTSLEGVRKGSVLSLRRERLPLVHPVTGEYLGELDEEIGTARVIELRERFTVAEIEELRRGVELKVKDRVIVKPE